MEPVGDSSRGDRCSPRRSSCAAGQRVEIDFDGAGLPLAREAVRPDLPICEARRYEPTADDRGPRRQRLLRHLELDRPDAAEVEGLLSARRRASPRSGCASTRSTSRWWRWTRPSTRCRRSATPALWAERTPAHFVFNVKAFGLMTQHAVAAKSLPEPIRDMLPEETAAKARVYARDLPRGRAERGVGHVRRRRCGRSPTPASSARSCSSSRTGSRPAARTSPTCASSPSARRRSPRSSSAAPAG